MSPEDDAKPTTGGIGLLYEAIKEKGWGEIRPPFEPMAVTPVEHRDVAYAAKASKWCSAALSGKAGDLADMAPETGRNNALNNAALQCYRYVLAGYLDGEQVTDVLRDAALMCGLSNGAIEATLQSAQRGAEKYGPQEPPLDPPAVALPDVDLETGEVRLTLEQMAERTHQRKVADELALLRARDEAKTIFVAEKSDREFREPPYRPTLTAELLEPRLPTRFAVQDLLPAGGNALLTAQYKAGKTTFVTELARCWVDEQDFLGKFPIFSTRRVALWNYELSQNQYDEWLEQAGITNTDRISVLHLRGYRLDLRSPKGERWAADWLRDHDIGLWVPDPFARAAVGVDENSNSEVGVWLDTLDVIKEKGGVDESVLPVHTGRAVQESGQERARGATRLDDWADARWLLTKDDAGERYFRATGRDVEMDEEKLIFEPTARHLTIGGGDRAWHAKRRAEDAVVSYVELHPGANGKQIHEGIGGGDKTATPRALASAVAGHRLKMRPGKGPEKLYFPVSMILSEDSF